MTELRVGILTLVSIIGLVMMSFKITSNQSGIGDYVQYETVLKDASGIFPKTPIKVAGIPAGRIVDISLEDNQARITFEILKKVELTEGSKLQVRSVGFLGDKYLAIVLGKGPIALSEGAEIGSVEGGGIEKLADEAADVLDDVKAIVGEIRGALVPADGSAPLRKMVADMDKIMESTKKLTSSLNETISGNKERIDAILANIEEVSEKLNYETNGQENEALMGRIKDVAANAQEMTKDLKIIAANIRQGKGTLGQILVDDKIADEVKVTLSGVNRIVNRMNTLRTELEVFSGGNTEFGSETWANIRIFPGPERFYALGIVTSEFGPFDEDETIWVRNGVESSETRKTRKKGSYRFNLQAGRNLHNWTFRGGLIESTGGLGIDYRFPSLGLSLSSEFFDYRDDLGLNVRLRSELHIWNVIYAQFLADDIITKERNYTLAAGLRFSDEDLRGLVGFFF